MLWFRHCMDCGRRIEKCDGSVMARYALLALYGVTPYTLVREKCPRCATAMANPHAA